MYVLLLFKTHLQSHLFQSLDHAADALVVAISESLSVASLRLSKHLFGIQPPEAMASGRNSAFPMINLWLNLPPAYSIWTFLFAPVVVQG
jgi:hypothetical protein